MKPFSKYTYNNFLKGASYTFATLIKKDNNPVNLDDFDKIYVYIYTKQEMTLLKQFSKSDLSITDPTSGIFKFTLSGADTQLAETTLYIIEIKLVSTSQDKEITQKGYFGAFYEAYSNEIH